MIKALSSAHIKEFYLYPAKIMTVEISRGHIKLEFFLSYSETWYLKSSFSERDRIHLKRSGGRKRKGKEKNLSLNT